MRYRIDAVRWTDAELNTENETAIDDTTLGKPPSVLSVGVVVRDTDESVVLALEIYEERRCRSFLTIPKGMITRRRRIGSVEWK